MSLYYLMAQLPSLDGIADSSPVPITEERFNELCGRFLSKKAADRLKELTLIPPRERKSTGSPLIDAWNGGERALRLALGRVRAEKLKKSFDTGTDAFPAEIMQTALKAAEMTDPLEAEVFLNRYRMDFLETLRPCDTFAEDSVFYYGLKLKLLCRIKQFDTAAGEAAYRNIYRFVMSGENLEGI